MELLTFLGNRGIIFRGIYPDQESAQRAYAHEVRPIGEKTTGHRMIPNPHGGVGQHCPECGGYISPGRKPNPACEAVMLKYIRIGGQDRRNSGTGAMTPGQ